MSTRFFKCCFVVLLIPLCSRALASTSNFNALVAGTSYAAPAIFSNGGLDFELLFSLGDLNVLAVSGQVNPAFNGNYLRLTSNTALYVNLPTGASQIQFDFIRNSSATAFMVNGNWFDVNLLPLTINGISISNTLPTMSNWGSVSVTETINTFYIIGTNYLIDNLNTTQLPGVAGDYNRSNVVDGADFVLLRKRLFTQTGFKSWRTFFGTSGVTPSEVRAIPEPAALLRGGFKLLGRAALLDHPPRWLSPYRTSPASQSRPQAQRLQSSIVLLRMLSNHITSFERED